ncbi:MAG TPA: UV DNA damage repair endonuclease UvsE [Chthoniobacterales bacterium]
MNASKALAEGLPPSRLGFAVNVLGQPGLKSADTRRWQKHPHLRTSLGYLKPIFTYLEKHEILMYRMSSQLAPYLTHPDLPQFHRQIEESRDELTEVGGMARGLKLRLSFHPSQYVILNSPDEQLNRKSVLEVQAQVDLLDAMQLGPEGVVVIHVGGAYGDPRASRERWVRTYETLSPEIRKRLVLENDDVSFSAADVLFVHERTGVPLVFDHQHFCCLNPEQLDLADTVGRFLRTWPAGVRPKLHFSSPRTQFRETRRRDRNTKKFVTVILPPRWTGHADYCDPFTFINVMRSVVSNAPFDVMLEAKAKDLALRRLRSDMAMYAPDLAARFACAHTENPSRNDPVLLLGEPVSDGTAMPEPGS